MNDDQSRTIPHLTPRPEAPAAEDARPGLGGWLRNLFGGGQPSHHRHPNGNGRAHGAANGLPSDANSMMRNLMEFADLRVDDVMVPRADIIAIDENSTVRELLQRFMEANHSRLPVYRETLDDPVGMLHIKDFLRWLVERGAAQPRRRRSRTVPVDLSQAAVAVSPADLDVPIKQTGIIRDLLFVPPSMPAGDLLVKMQSTRSHMAIVVDEYGGTDGLVTIEDLVEEIVGDIADEHDVDEAELIKPGEDGVFIADARAAIEDVESLLGIDLLPEEREEDADTLGGLMVAMLGRLPVRGELLRHEAGLEFEILEADPRRVKKIRIHTRPRPPRQRRKEPDGQG
jgi:CBS domain containing-hemolysin-like protein